MTTKVGSYNASDYFSPSVRGLIWIGLVNEGARVDSDLVAAIAIKLRRSDSEKISTMDAAAATTTTATLVEARSGEPPKDVER